MRKPEKRTLKSRFEEGAMAAGVVVLAGGLLLAFLAVSAWLAGALGPRKAEAAPLSLHLRLK